MRQISILKNRKQDRIYIHLEDSTSYTHIVYDLYCEDCCVETKESTQNIKQVVFSINSLGKYHVKVKVYRGEKANIMESDVLSITQQCTLLRPRIENNLMCRHYTQEENQYELYIQFNSERTESYHSKLASLVRHKDIELVPVFQSHTKELFQLNDIDERLAFTYRLVSEISLLKKELLAKFLEKKPYVRYCFLETGKISEPIECKGSKTSSTQNEMTPSFLSEQEYLNKEFGMNIIEVWRKTKGENAQVRHLDFGYNDQHEEFVNNPYIQFINTEGSSKDHGTASLGILAGQDNDLGITGICHQSKVYTYGTSDFERIAEEAKAGDIVSLDIQYSVNGKLLPFDHSARMAQLITELTLRNVVVVLAAANGGIYLDKDPDYNNPGNYGGIKIGASNKEDHRRCYFSNYGETVYLNSWGDWSVTTTGYGNFYGEDENHYYTDGFSGTSAATPLCAGVLALLQSYAITQYQTVLSSFDMIEILDKTGYHGADYSKIGALPDTESAIKYIDSILSLDGENIYNHIVQYSDQYNRKYNLNHKITKVESSCSTDDIESLNHLKDMDTLTQWDSSKKNSDQYKNWVRYTLNDLVTLNRIVLCRSSEGIPPILEEYNGVENFPTSCTLYGTDRNEKEIEIFTKDLLTLFETRDQSHTHIEIPFSPVEVSDLRLVFNNTLNNSAGLCTWDIYAPEKPSQLDVPNIEKLEVNSTEKKIKITLKGEDLDRVISQVQYDVFDVHSWNSINCLPMGRFCSHQLNETYNFSDAVKGVHYKIIARYKYDLDDGLGSRIGSRGVDLFF